MATLAITEAELLDELALAAPGKAPANARTTMELAQMAGLSHDAIQERIKRLHALGRVVVHTVYRPNVTGKMVQKPAYTFLKAKKR